MSTLLICPSGAVSQVLDRLGLAADDATEATTVVTWSPADVAPTATRRVVTVGRPAGALGAAVSRVLSRSVIGRNVLRLTPWDAGRRMARAALRDEQVRAAAASADLIVAVERDGILTAWKAARRWSRPDTHAVYGAAAATALLRQRSAG